MPLFCHCISAEMVLVMSQESCAPSPKLQVQTKIEMQPVCREKMTKAGFFFLNQYLKFLNLINMKQLFYHSIS